MFDGLIYGGAALVHWDLRTSIAVAFFSLFAFTKLITFVRSTLALRRSGQEKDPPIVPYSVPGLGNALTFGFDTLGFLTSLYNKYGRNLPVQFRVLNQKICYISGPKSVLALFKGSRQLTTKPSSVLVLVNAFGFGSESAHVLHRDDTGVLEKPIPGSAPLEPRNRIFHITHKTIHDYLMGTNLVTLASKFVGYLETELGALDIGDEWTEVPDFYAIIQKAIFTASTTAICGPHIFALNPNFNDEFWAFDDGCIQTLFKGIPRWLAPKSYRIRDKCKASIRKWQKYAFEHFDWDDEELANQEWDEYYGGKLMRERSRRQRLMDGMNDDAMAGNDLGMIWGANANIVPMIGWTLIDVLMRPSVLSQVRSEIFAAPGTSHYEQMLVLLSNPLLQSIYSEELRLRNGVIIQRVPIVDNFKIGPWKFPKGDMVVASSWHEQRDRNVWNEGPVNGEFHSVEDFWAERFLVYPNDPSTGPRKPGSEDTTKTTRPGEEEKGDKDKPVYTTESVTGSYIPYGGGHHMCPGRFYAKQEAIGAMVIFLSMFDIELKRAENDFPKPNLDYFPFGVVPPVGKLPARMRRRKQI